MPEQNIQEPWLKYRVFNIHIMGILWASQVALVVKNLPANAGDLGDKGSISVGKIPWRHGNPHQYSCLESPMDRGVWKVTVPTVSVSQTQLKRLSFQAQWENQKTEK